MHNDDRNDTNDLGGRRELEPAMAETKSAGMDGHTDTGNTSHDRPSLETPQEGQDSDHHREPYSVFTGWDRYSIVFMASLASLYSPLTANIYFPAIPTMANAFHVSIEAINITVTVYMVVQGLSPSIWGSVADRKGRRISFILCLLLLMITSVGLALTPTSAYWLLVVLRCLQAGGSASTVALTAGVIADIIPTKDRGGYIGIANLGAMIGPCIGPVIGGILVDKLGWRSIFWFIVIAASVCVVLVTLFLPETLRSMVDNGSIPAPRWNRALIPIIGRRVLSKSSHRPPPRPVPNPFMVFTNPDLVVLLFSTAVVYSAYYSITATLSDLFQEQYPFLTETDIGLCFLAVGGGGAVGTVLQGKVLDWQFMHVKKQWERKKAMKAGTEERDTERGENVNALRQGGHDEDTEDEDFPIEKATLASQGIWIELYSAASIGYGWSIEKGANIAVPLVMQFILGYCMIAVMTNTQTLIVDLFPGQGASITAANNLVRCIMGAIAVSIINVITSRIRPGWTYTLGAFLCLATYPFILLVMYKLGPRWRKIRRERERLREKEERANEKGANTDAEGAEQRDATAEKLN